MPACNHRAITPMAIADALEALLPSIAEIQEIMQDAPPHVRNRAFAWMSKLDEATGTEPETTIEDTIRELRSM